jgi:hypothetical protein
MPVHNWQQSWNQWKTILEKPKNLGLKAGGTGIGKLLEAARDKDNAMGTALNRGHETMKAYRELQAALNALGAQCKAISDKHKKVYTEACTFLDGVRQEATARNVQATNEVDHYRQQISAELRHAHDQLNQLGALNDNFQNIWNALIHECEHILPGFPRMKGYLDQMKREPLPMAPGHKTKEVYVKHAHDISDLGVINDR